MAQRRQLFFDINMYASNAVIRGAANEEGSMTETRTKKKRRHRQHTKGDSFRFYRDQRFVTR